MLSSACALALGLALGASFSQERAPAPPVDRPFHQLLPNLVTDFKSLPSRNSAIIGAVGTAVTFALRPADEHIENSDEEEHSEYADLGAWLGDGWVQAGAAVATYTVGAAIKHAPTRHIGSDLIRAQLVNGLLTRALKLVVDRKRPDGGGHSFPSGHTSATFATAGVLGAHFGWKVAVPAYAIAGFVGWARVRDDQHWATDVAAGATLGAVVGYSVARTHSSSWTVVPTVSRTSQGILFVRN